MAKKKQKYIEGTEPVLIPDLEDAAEKYRSIRDRRKNLKEDMDHAGERLLDKMKENSLTIYKTAHGQLVTIEAGSAKIKIKSAVDNSAK